MAFQLIWSPSAQLDLKDIGDFIGEDSPPAARRFIKSLFQVVDKEKWRTLITRSADSARMARR